MQVLKLIMGEDEDCLLCLHPDPHHRWPKDAPFPWKLCPTHFGELDDDPEITKLRRTAEALG